MKKQKIVWTLLPNGVAKNGLLKLSLFCAPQLETDETAPGETPGRPTLVQFQQLWKDWPEIVRSLKFKVQFDPDGTTATIVDAVRVSMMASDNHSSEYWHRVFPADLYIRPFKFDDMTGQNIYSYPVGNILGYFKNLYGATAVVSPQGFPSKTDLWEKGELSKIHFYQANDRISKLQPPGAIYHAALVKQMDTHHEGRNRAYKNNAVPPSAPDPTMDFFQLSNFHQPHSKPLPDKPYTTKFGKKGMISGGYERISDAKLKRPDGVHDQTDLDFHAIIGGLGDYPALMRELGVVIDLELKPPAGYAKDSKAKGLPTVQPIIEWPGGITVPEQVRCKTVYHQHAEVFLPKPRPDIPEIDDDGLVRLNDKLPDQSSAYHLVQIDVDGAGIKLMNTAYNLVQAEAHRTQDTPNFSSLPTLRSAGFSIARTGAAIRLAESLQDQQKLFASNPKEPVMFAEDLLRGYRMDVHDSRTIAWHSLYERLGVFDFKLSSKLTLEDEGFTQIGTMQAADGFTNDLFLHESFVSWQGWSLVAPRPGNAMNNDGLSVQQKDLNPPNKYHPNFKPKFSVKPGSLPGLRFGLRYRLRVRAVDLAGNSASALNPNDFSSATEEEVYSRFEPIASPPVVLYKKLTEYTPPSPYAKTTSPGESLERIVIRSYNSDPPTMNLVDTAETSSRHLAPPKVGITLTEQHGKLDLAYTVPDWSTKDESARKAIFNEQFSEVSKRADGSFAQTKPINSDAFPPSLSSPQPAPPASSPGATFPIYTNDKLDKLPYLPDPIAAGVTFIDLPGLLPNTKFHFPGSGSTPGPLDPHVLKENVTQVDFHKGDQWYDITGFRIELHDATELEKTSPGHPALPKWDDGNRVLNVYLEKAQTALVPYTSFIDANPLMLGDKEPGAAGAPLDAMGIWQWVLSLKIPSAILAELRKFIEQGRAWMISPPRYLVLVHAVQKPLFAPIFKKLSPMKYLGDTYATLTDSLTINGASSGKIDLRADWSEPVDDVRDPIWKRIKGTAQVFERKIEDPKTTVVAINDAHNFGDTKHRMINYTAVASTRFREYFPADLTKDEANISMYGLNPGPVNILNSARPIAPDLLYMVPLFGWERPAGNAKGEAHKRHGNALRIYLNRPWFNSGEGEELGVLIWTDNFNAIPEKYQHYVTQWGMDPIWGGNHPTGSPSLDSFPRKKHWHQDVTLDEVASNTLEILKEVMIDLGPILAASKSAPTKETSKSKQIDVGALATTQATINQPKRQYKDLSTATRGTNASKYTVISDKPVQYFLKPSLVVVGHEVLFDPVRQLWYCDIEIDAGPSYTPFVRLALTRFQPDSVDNAHVSRVVVADFAQLLPDRNVAVIFDPVNPKLILVAVSGRTYSNAPTAYETGHPQVGSTMEVAVEVARPDITDEGEELRWAPIPDATHQLQSQVGDDSMGVWTAFITLPEPRGARKYRLVFKEFEHFLSDVLDDYNSVPSFAAREKVKSTAKRLVFAESIEI